MKAVLIAIGEDIRPGIHTGAETFPTWVGQYLADHGIDNVYAPCYTREDLERYASDADVVWMFSGSRILTAENLSVLRQCRLILKVGSGVDNIDVEAAARLGIAVANTPAIVTETVAEHTIALLLAAARRIPLHDSRVKRGQWSYLPHRPGRILNGATLGLIGFGRIARRVVQKLHGFNLHV